MGQRALNDEAARRQARGETVTLWDLVTDALQQWRGRQEASDIAGA
jgi:hypothetical protein